MFDLIAGEVQTGFVLKLRKPAERGSEMKHEKDILQSLNTNGGNDHVIRVVDFIGPPDDIQGLILPKFDLNVMEIAKKVRGGGSLMNSFSLHLCHHMADAVSFCHSNNVKHCDINPSNVMLDKVNRRFVLIDFGKSRTEDRGKWEGSPSYMPPGDTDYNLVEADYWSLGCTLFAFVYCLDPVQPERIEEFRATMALAPREHPIDIIKTFYKRKHHYTFTVTPDASIEPHMRVLTGRHDFTRRLDPILEDPLHNDYMKQIQEDFISRL